MAREKSASIYDTILGYVEHGGNLWEKVQAMGLGEVFHPLAKLYVEGDGDHGLFNKALFFILHCYSRESAKHIEGSSWQETKSQVAEELKIELAQRTQLMRLDSAEIRSTINRYLDWQGSKTYRHLQMLRDQYEIMVNSAVFVGSGSVDYDQMRKNAKYARELYDEIEEWESRYEQEEKPVEEARKEIKAKEKGKAKRQRYTSVRPEDMIRELERRAEEEEIDVSQE